MKKNRVPRYNSFIFLLLPFFIYSVLNFSLVGTMFTQDILKFVTQMKPEIRAMILDEANSEIVIPHTEQDERVKQIYLRDYLGSLIILIILIVIFNAPFKTYFRRKRKDREISNYVDNYTKTFINFSPEIIGLLVLLSFVYIHFSFYRLRNSVSGDIYMSNILMNILIISSFTSLLVLLMVYFGQKYRVQTKYIEHVFPKERLRNRPKGFNFPGLRGRFFITTIFITIVPLVIVLFYVISSVTIIDNLSSLSDEKLNTILGDWVKLLAVFTDLTPREFLQGADGTNRLLFIDSFGIVQLFVGIVPGLIFSFIYIVTIVRWSNISILKPVYELLKAMKQVEKGDLDSYTVVRSREETGELSHGFNKMLDGLKDRDRIKSLFGQYLSAEISEEILKGNVDLDGSIYQATILFSDIRGFTTLSESITPHETISFLNEYYNLMIDVIHQHGGIIDKFLGDGVLVLFGVPVASKDHADRAVAAAFAMREKLDVFNRSRTERGLFTINIGIGIHSGEVIAGNVGNTDKLEYTVIGDTVNVASRIESLTKKFETNLLIGESVYDNLSKKNSFKERFEKLNGVTLKGKRVKVNLLKLNS